MDQISFESVHPLTFDGGLKFSVPLAVMVTKNSKWRKIFWGTDIKNLYSRKLRLAAVYRLAKFRDDTTKFKNYNRLWLGLGLTIVTVCRYLHLALLWWAVVYAKY